VSTAPPGWYPDPTDDFERRWWDGDAWTEHVSTGRFTGRSPVRPPTIPAREAVVWSGSGAVFTTHRVQLPDGWRTVELGWWLVQAARPLGSDVLLVLDYPGYTDRRERRIRAVADADQVAAIARMWARRHRRSVGL
jgi:hypothetical protein